jgi:hypothetical protein
MITSATVVRGGTEESVWGRYGWHQVLSTSLHQVPTFSARVDSRDERNLRTSAAAALLPASMLAWGVCERMSEWLRESNRRCRWEQLYQTYLDIAQR